MVESVYLTKFNIHQQKIIVHIFNYLKLILNSLIIHYY